MDLGPEGLIITDVSFKLTGMKNEPANHEGINGIVFPGGNTIVTVALNSARNFSNSVSVVASIPGHSVELGRFQMPVP